MWSASTMWLSKRLKWIKSLTIEGSGFRQKNTEFNKIWNRTMEFSALVIYFFSTMNPSLSLSYYLMVKPLYDFNADMIPCDLLFVLMN